MSPIYGSDQLFPHLEKNDLVTRDERLCEAAAWEKQADGMETKNHRKRAVGGMKRNREKNPLLMLLSMFSSWSNVDRGRLCEQDVLWSAWHGECREEVSQLKKLACVESCNGCSERA